MTVGLYLVLKFKKLMAGAGLVLRSGSLVLGLAPRTCGEDRRRECTDERMGTRQPNSNLNPKANTKSKAKYIPHPGGINYSGYVAGGGSTTPRQVLPTRTARPCAKQASPPQRRRLPLPPRKHPMRRLPQRQHFWTHLPHQS